MLFSPYTVSVPALVGGLFSISLGISPFASLGMNSSFDCQMCLQSLLFFLRNNLPSSGPTVWDLLVFQLVPWSISAFRQRLVVSCFLTF